MARDDHGALGFLHGRRACAEAALTDLGGGHGREAQAARQRRHERSEQRSHVSLLRLPAMALRWAGRLVCIQGERALYCWFLQVQLERVL